MAGEARKRDSGKSYRDENGMLINAARDAYNSSRSICPHAVTDKFGTSACGLVLVNTPTNKSAGTGTLSVAQCNATGAQIDDRLCARICEEAVNF